MAKDKSNNDAGDLKLEALDMVRAKQFGVSPAFLRKHDKLISEVEATVISKVSTRATSNKVTKRGTTPSSEYARLISSTMDSDRLINGYITGGKNKNGEQSDISTSISGAHSVAESDNGAVDSLVGVVKDHFANMPEYERVVDLIPELGKVVENLVRDVINRDEISRKALSNFYDDPDDTIRTTAEKAICDLLEEYKIEKKLPNLMEVAEISGAKPISVLPQGDIVDMINKVYSKLKTTGMESDSISLESLLPKPTDFLEVSSLQQCRNSLESFNAMSTESADFEVVRHNTESMINRSLEGVITDDMVAQYTQLSSESFNTRMNHKMSVAYAKDDGSMTSLETIRTDMNEKFNDEANYTSIEAQSRNALQQLALELDRSIEVVDPRQAHKYTASKKLSSNTFYESKYDAKTSIDNFYRVDDGTGKGALKGKDTSKKEFVLDGEIFTVDGTTITGDEFTKTVARKRAIMTEYEPENVVPVIIGGNHEGYYVIESVTDSGNNFRKAGTFTELIKSLGVADDAALMKSGASKLMSNSFSAPIADGVFYPAISLNPHGDNGDIFGGGAGNTGTKLIKKILLKLVGKRLGNQELIENGGFQSAIMNFLKDDANLRGKVRYTFIPESHMVYMNRRLDKNGLPKSIYDGTLFNAYIYISSMISSMMMKIMKASDKEIIEVNMGKSKELGMTIASIAKSASMRNITASTLLSGTSSIIKNVGTFEKVIVPNIDGEKLYSVEQAERVNDVDIDDEYTQRNLKSIVLRSGATPASVDMLDENDYAASIAQHRLDYRSLVDEAGVAYSEDITKLIRLIVTYSDLVEKDDEKKEVKDVEDGKKKDGKLDDEGNPAKDAADVITSESDNVIDPEKITFNFNPPKSLTINKLGDELSEIKVLVEELVEVFLPEDDRNGKEWPVYKANVKKALVMALSNSTDWSLIMKTIEGVKEDTPKETSEMTKHDVDIVGGDGDDQY